MSQLVKGSNRQGWRFSVYGIILIYLLFVYSDDKGFLGVGAIEDKSISTAVAGKRKQPESGLKVSSAETNMENQSAKTNNLIESFPGVDAPESDISDEMTVSDSSFYEHVPLVEREIKKLLHDRTVVYEDNRTLTVSEVAELHSIKDSKDSPFAITNEAQLILRELAIEHRIPQECAEDLSDECLIVMERSQAGSIPSGCQLPRSNEECEEAFAWFWGY